MHYGALCGHGYMKLDMIEIYVYVCVCNMEINKNFSLWCISLERSVASVCRYFVISSCILISFSLSLSFPLLSLSFTHPLPPTLTPSLLSPSPHSLASPPCLQQEVAWEALWVHFDRIRSSSREAPPPHTRCHWDSNREGGKGVNE